MVDLMTSDELSGAIECLKRLRCRANDKADKDRGAAAFGFYLLRDIVAEQYLLREHPKGEA